MKKKLVNVRGEGYVRVEEIELESSSREQSKDEQDGKRKEEEDTWRIVQMVEEVR